MRIEKKTNNDERKILTSMVVDRVVLGRVFSKHEPNMFQSKWANLIARWCIKYYKKYGKAPLKHIEDSFETWAAKTKDKHTINLVEKFLSHMSNEYEELKEQSNSDFMIDAAGRYFNQVKIQKLLDSVQEDLDESDPEKATAALTSYNQIQMGVGEGIDVLQDVEAIKECLADTEKTMIRYSGALGEFLGNALTRDSFVAFTGPDKVGKSFHLMDVAYRAMAQRKRVAYFEAGDQSKNQVMRRLMIRISQRPIYPAVVEYPKSLSVNEKYKVKVKWKHLPYKKKMSWQKAREACKKVMKRTIKSKKSYLRLSCHPNSTLSVQDIQSILQGWARQDWVPDVLIIDYADILNMNSPGLEGRDLIDETWKRLRSLSQIYHCLVVTATQSDAAAYDTRVITKKNFSGDKRKNAHVTGMIGLNQTPAEKKKGVTRLNWVVLREGKFSETKCVYVAGALSIASPCIKSCWKD